MISDKNNSGAANRPCTSCIISEYYDRDKRIGRVNGRV